MKKIYLLLSFFVVGLLGAQAQIVLSDLPSGTIQTDPFLDKEVKIWVKNPTTNNKYVKVSRVENNLGNPNHETYFCWDVCYSASVNNSTHALEIAPNDSVDSFKLYFVPNGYAGITSVKMRFFDDPNNADYVEHTFVFDAVSTGIEDDLASKTLAPPYPNPATNYTTVNYQLYQAGTRQFVKMYNVIGRELYSQAVYGNTGNVAINTENLNAGIYFINLLVDGKVVSSRKLVVQ